MKIDNRIPPARFRFRQLLAVFLAISVLQACSGGDDSGLSVLRTCGNGVVEEGETCDPGGVCNNDGSRCLVGQDGGCAENAICLPADTETCSSICNVPLCGDGLAQGGLEQCDTFDLRDATCADFGRDIDPEAGPLGGLACTDTCTLDPSGCGSVFTPTPAATPTFTVTNTPATQPPTPTITNTPTPTGTPTPPCNLPILEPGEFFDDPDIGIVGDPDGTSCPEDAEVLACDPTTDQISFEVVFFGAVGTQPNSTTMLVGYRSDLVELGDRDRDAAVDIGPDSFVFTTRDLDYAIRLVWTGTSSPLTDPAGVPLVELNFNLCDGADEPMLEDLACQVEGCSGVGGPIRGCACEVRLPTDAPQ
jgi:hypothetical protein